MKIPCEHHRFLIGQKGKRLQELELVTQTKITIPRPEENSEFVHILGTKDGIERARHEIQCISDEQVLHFFTCFMFINIISAPTSNSVFS